MAQITIDIPDAIAQRVLETLARRFGYHETIRLPDGTTEPNPETKAHFVKRKIAELLKQLCVAQEAQDAAQAARSAAHDGAVGEITIT